MVDSAGAQPALIWLRDDLRLADNPALTAACRHRGPVVLLYVHDEQSPEIRPLGGAARWWLHHALSALSADLASHGLKLVLRHGPAARVVPAVAGEVGANAVFWNRRHGAPARIDDAVAEKLARRRVPVETFEANLLFSPGAVRTGAGTAFRVFSAFWRAALAAGEPRQPLPVPRRFPSGLPELPSDDLESYGLLQTAPDWAADIRAVWRSGEHAALARLEAFTEHVAAYGETRDVPAAEGTSRLSPHLRFGEISPYQVWHAVSRRGGVGTTKFLSELGWREFAWHQLAANPDLAQRNLNSAFDDFPWGDTYADDIWAWRRGRTGYPIVDAGMRQLWQTGWMHNRVRMIVASFLVKHLLADWRIGEEWFWDTLVDADAANNPVNWQWVAGSGADAQPFFRIFNPVLQGEKFDANGAYVRRFVPELAELPNRYIHKPWQAPAKVLEAAGVTLGATYPLPIVDHAEARKRALEAYATLRHRNERGG